MDFWGICMMDAFFLPSSSFRTGFIFLSFFRLNFFVLFISTVQIVHPLVQFLLRTSAKLQVFVLILQFQLIQKVTNTFGNRFQNLLCWKPRFNPTLICLADLVLSQRYLPLCVSQRMRIRTYFFKRVSFNYQIRDFYVRRHASSHFLLCETVTLPSSFWYQSLRSNRKEK